VSAVSVTDPPADRFPFAHPEPVGRHPELPDGAPPSAGRPGWRPASSFLALVTGFAGTLLGGLILGILGVLVTGGDLDDSPGWVNVGGTIVQDACLIGAALLFAKAWATPRPEHFGLRVVPLWPALGWALATWASFFLFTGAFISILGLDPSEEDIQDQLGVDGTSGLVAIAVLVTVVAPVAEEEHPERGRGGGGPRREREQEDREGADEPGGPRPHRRHTHGTDSSWMGRRGHRPQSDRLEPG